MCTSSGARLITSLGRWGTVRQVSTPLSIGEAICGYPVRKRPGGNEATCARWSRPVLCLESSSKMGVKLSPEQNHLAISRRQGTGGAKRKGRACGRWLRVQVPHPFAVAVEQLRRPHFAGAEHVLAGLAPARVRHGRVDVGLEVVLARLERVPEGRRLLGGELDPRQ